MFCSNITTSAFHFNIAFIPHQTHLHLFTFYHCIHLNHKYNIASGQKYPKQLHFWFKVSKAIHIICFVFSSKKDEVKSLCPDTKRESKCSKKKIICYHAIASGLVRNIRTLSAYAVILWRSSMAEANNWSEYFIPPRGLMSVISPESMSQDCYLWSSVFYSHLFIKFEYLNFPEVWSLSFPPNQKNSPNVFVHSWHFKGLVWLNAHSLTQDSDLHGNVIGVIPKMTRGTLTFIIIFVRDSISIHDLMSLRALCFKLMYRQCYLSMDWRRCWQEQTELLFRYFLVTFLLGAICPTSCLLKMPISGAPQSRAAMTVQQIGFPWSAWVLRARVAPT